MSAVVVAGVHGDVHVVLVVDVAVTLFGVQGPKPVSEALFPRR